MIEQNNSDILDKKIEAWKNKLIDLSRRNRLLNFRSTKVTTIKIIDEIPSEVFKSMVIDNNSFHFLPKEKETEELFDQSQKDSYDEQDVEFCEYETEDLEGKHTDLNLQTNLLYERLQKNLKRIHFRANQLMEEQGYNILYLTLGMLEWYEAEQSDIKNRSPLIMLPVQLKKRSIRSKYKLYHTDEEPFVNPALQYKMDNEFNLSIPDLQLDNDSFDPKSYLSELIDSIKRNPRWKITNEIYLGLFSFAKFVMFKDLEKYNETFKNNPIVQALAGVSINTVDSGAEYITANELDEKRKPLELYQVLDADSSQQEAIEAVKVGNSIVVQGPPGTGKSQTITNLITELMANNKKVLFVSEKMAALEVVYNRLQSIGLSEYCLEIHSRKANKRYVLNQLKDAYESRHPGKPIIYGEIDELVKKRKQLNDYSIALHTPVKPFDKTPYWFLGELNQITDVEILDIDFSELSDISYEQYVNIITIISTLKERIEMIGHPHSHPFWGCEINNINEYQKQQLSKNLDSVTSFYENLKDQIKSFSDELKIELKDLSTTISYCQLLTILSENHKIPISLAAVLNVYKYDSELSSVLEEIDLLIKQAEEIAEIFKEEVFNEEVNEILELLKTKYKSFWRIFNPSFYKTRKKITQYYIGSDDHQTYPELITNLEKIISHIELKRKIEDTQRDITDPLSTLWEGTNSNTNVIRIAITWMIKYQESRITDKDDQALSEFILDSSSIPEELIENKTSIEVIIPDFIEKVKKVFNDLAVDTNIIFADGIEKINLPEIGELLNNWKNNIQLIVDWTRYQRAFINCKKAGLESFLDKMYSDDTRIEELIQKFKKSFLYHHFQNGLNENPILRDFEALTQNQIVKKFQELDSFQLDLARIRVLVNLYESKPDSSWEGTKTSQLGYLQRQFRLKRGHHPIRKIFANVPNIVQQLCPCLMMSPLSLSQYIDPEKIKFDFVIFDEASQMCPVDSLGAIIRGEHLVCVGDTKQLPPTTFFDKVVQIEFNDEDLEDLSTPDLESILDECLTIGMKEFYLKWHYRSRHESLIHFSNTSFYKNNLVTFPNPIRDNNSNGLSFIHIVNGIYDRGGSQKNLPEAQEVAKAVFVHYRNNPEKSLGIGTFSQSQQTAILDELEILRRNDLSLEHFFTDNREESFFVKNLETIQGDERDVIFISVGYGRDVNGKITMNFGPLNKAGGERRLNVLVTRAREKVVVFSSITGDDFDLSKTQALGVHKLKQYLDFARYHEDSSFIIQSEDLSGDFDETNVFERGVYNQLQQKGIKAIPQVGYAGYKIDFGILHPDNPSKFILALECDGANYHSSATARDRDRLRQQVLENLGWRFYRIWSTDWFLNPSREMTKLLEAIEDAKSSPLNLTNRNQKPELEVEEIEQSTNQNILGIEIIPYTKYPVSYKGEPELFYEEVESYRKYNEIRNIIEEIVKIESPIHIKELSLRVIQHYEMGRVGAKIIRIMNSLVKQLNENGKLHIRWDFIYSSNKPLNYIRKRDTLDSVTNVEYISREEIQNAINLVLSKEISTPREELIPKVARVFGFQHTGKKIQEHINKQITYLLRNKTIFNSAYGLQKSK